MSNEFVEIGIASTDNLGLLVGMRAKRQNDIELQSFHNWTRFNELIILAWATIKTDKNDQVMATQTCAKIGRAANFEPISGNISHIFEICLLTYFSAVLKSISHFFCH